MAEAVNRCSFQVDVGNIKDMNKDCRMAVDIGGSLIKWLKFFPDEEGDCKIGKLELVSYPIEQLSAFIQDAKSFTKSLPSSQHILAATGLGFISNKDKIASELGVSLLLSTSEFDCSFNGFKCLMQNHSREFNIFEDNDENLKTSEVSGEPNNSAAKNTENQDKGNDKIEPVLPCLFVTFGTGVAFVKVDADGTSKLVGASNRGASSLYAEASYMTGTDSFDDIIAMAEKGDEKKVSLVFSDLYDVDLPNLSQDVVITYFGKLRKPKSKEATWQKEDIAACLVHKTAHEVAHLAFLYASLYNLPMVYFSGSFLTRSRKTRDFIRQALKLNKGEQFDAVTFLRYGGYLSAIGCWIQPEGSADKSDYDFSKLNDDL